MRIKILTIASFLFLRLPSFGDDLDLLIISEERCNQEINTDKVKVVTDKQIVGKIYNVVKKSEAGDLLCGFDYKFDFYSNGELQKTLIVDSENESSEVLKAIEPFFPDNRDLYRLYFKTITNKNDIGKIRNGLDKDEYLLFSFESLERFPKRMIYIAGNFECEKNDWKECLPMTDYQDSIFKAKVESMIIEIDKLDPLRVSYFENISSTGPKYYHTRIGLNVWTKILLDQKFSDIKIKYQDIIDSIKIVPEHPFNAVLVTQKEINDQSIKAYECIDIDHVKKE